MIFARSLPTGRFRVGCPPPRSGRFLPFPTGCVAIGGDFLCNLLPYTQNCPIRSGATPAPVDAVIFNKSVEFGKPVAVKICFDGRMKNSPELIFQFRVSSFIQHFDLQPRLVLQSEKIICSY